MNHSYHSCSLCHNYWRFTTVLCVSFALDSNLRNVYFVARWMLFGRGREPDVNGMVTWSVLSVQWESTRMTCNDFAESSMHEQCRKAGDEAAMGI